MPAFVGIALKFVGGLFGSLISAVAKYTAIFFAYRLGKRKAQQEQLKRNVEIKDEQLDIAARAPKHRRTLLERMRRRGGF